MVSFHFNSIKLIKDLSVLLLVNELIFFGLHVNLFKDLSVLLLVGELIFFGFHVVILFLFVLIDT